MKKYQLLKVTPSNKHIPVDVYDYRTAAAVVAIAIREQGYKTLIVEVEANPCPNCGEEVIGARGGMHTNCPKCGLHDSCCY